MARKVIGLAKNAVGRPGSQRRRWAFLVTLMVIMGAGLLVRQTLFDVHDTGAFQLDGDADTASQPFGTNSDDWDKVCYEVAVKPTTEGGLGLSAADAQTKCGIGAPTTGASAVTWVEELSAASSIFTGGGSKDPQDISNWRWKDDQNNPPDKDNLVHAYAARYQLDPDPATCPVATGLLKCDVIFFGSDRFDNSGDAHQAFWFLQQQVTLTNESANGGFKFDGLHTPGDILIISGFSNGGTTSTISVYKWDPTCLGDNKPDLSCDAENLRLLANLQGAAAKCSAALTGTDIGCGIVNPDLILMPWTFTDKSNTPNNGAINGEFFEAGINLSDPSINLSGECFSTVVAETRSSTSPTAVLKDFVVGQFAVCAPALTTQASTNATNVTPGTAVTDRAVVTVTGATNPDDATGTVQFSWCTATAANPTCTSGNSTNFGSPVQLTNAACSPASPSSTDGISCAVSPNFSPTTPGYYCFQAVATLTNYGSPTLTHTNTTTECFRVADTSSTTTAQRWVPNDTATVLKGAGGAASGSVVFQLFENGTCSGDPVWTSNSINLDSNGQAVSNNINGYVSPGITISWKVTFTSSDPNVGNSVGPCEKSILTITDTP